MNGRIAHNVEGNSRSKDVLVFEDIIFRSLLLPDFILKGLNNAGFKKPSPIQFSAIPLARCGLDLIVQAKSGTGKTLVFTVTTLEAVKVKLKRLQVIILAPTREIAIQNADVMKVVGQYLKGLKIGTFIGGMSMEGDKLSLPGCHVAVGAPGRVRHLIERDLMDIAAVRLLVLDEADKLMEQIFLNDINYIFNKCCSSKQTIACSATYTPDLLEFVTQYMRSGRHVIPDGNAVPVLLGLRQFIYTTNDHANNYARLKMKQEVLFQLLAAVRFDQALVFTNYITRAESLCALLINKGWSAACLNGKQTQEIRKETVERLKYHKVSILVATDVASRGLDASSINLVINLDVPVTGATYLHRMGRAGRFGSQGICITIVSEGPDCKRFCNLLGEIGGTSMSVDIIPKGGLPDLWTVNTDNFSKLFGTLPVVEEELSPSEITPPSGAQESNSSPICSETGSLIASSEPDTNCNRIAQSKKQTSMKRTSRDRKFSNSMREQIEDSDSSDYDQQIGLEAVEIKQTLSFACNDKICTSYGSSTSSHNSYQSTDNENYGDEAIAPSTNVASSETSSVEEEMEKLSLVRAKSNINTQNDNYQSNHNLSTNYNYHPNVNRYHCYSMYNNARIQDDDWYARIGMQIQNFVRYSRNFHHYPHGCNNINRYNL